MLVMNVVLKRLKIFKKYHNSSDSESLDFYDTILKTKKE